ncbi:hypothetical protein ACOSP7_017511 [Xanthoceras sorbifolium]
MGTLLFPHQTLVLKTAAISRLPLLTLIVLWRTLLNPYDTSASLNPDCLINSRLHQHSSNNSVGSKIENSVVWDSVYFVRIAQCRYEYEQTYAFLPLLPACISLLSHTVFAPLVAVIGYRAVLGLCGYVVSNIAFLFAAVYFYRLSVLILKDPEAAFRASILFCFNPASIFYSSIYSESLYALFSVGWNILLDTMHRAYDALPEKKWLSYGYRNICLGHSPDEMRPWCKARVPLLYNFIQSHYWKVGFLRYFQFKQLPNFLLASPIMSLALCSIIRYVKSQPKLFFSLGFQASKEGKDFAPVLSSSGTDPKSDSGCFSDTSSSKIHGFHAILVCKSSAYWFASYLMISPGMGKRWGYLIWAYRAAYILLGSLLFSNFYPFT